MTTRKPHQSVSACHTTLALAVALCLASAASAQLTLRSGDRFDTVLRVDTAGVRVQTNQGPQVISWDRVRSVEGAHANDATQFADLASDAWRARIRLTRGDFALAAPIFDRLFAALSDASGPTPLLAAKGALACRIARNDTMGAIEAHLVARRLGRMGAALPESTWRSRAGGASIDALDPTTLLAPALSPMLLLPGSPQAMQVWRRTRALLPDGKPLASADPVLLAWRLVAGAMVGAQDKRDLMPLRSALVQASGEAGDELIRDVALAFAGAPADRNKARDQLETGLVRDEGAWREAWRRMAIGRSLILEEGAGAQRLGAIALLHVTARFSESLPQHSATALALTAWTLHKLGDDAGASALRYELQQSSLSEARLDWLDAQQRARDATIPSGGPVSMEPNSPLPRSVTADTRGKNQQGPPS